MKVYAVKYEYQEVSLPPGCFRLRCEYVSIINLEFTEWFLSPLIVTVVLSLSCLHLKIALDSFWSLPSFFLGSTNLSGLAKESRVHHLPKA